MNATSCQLSFEFGGDGSGAVAIRETRREARQAVVRQVEYSPFPRVLPDQRPRMGFTRDVSESGLCLGSERARPVGSLLRVVVHRVDGRPALESVARVAWCGPGEEGRCWMGLALLAPRARGAVKVGFPDGGSSARSRARQT